MEVVERHRSPMSRQIHEGVELEACKAQIVMNSKSEWNHSKIPRIVIEVGEDMEQDNTNGMSRTVGEIEKVKRGKGWKTSAEKRRGSDVGREDVRETMSKRLKLGLKKRAGGKQKRGDHS